MSTSRLADAGHPSGGVGKVVCYNAGMPQLILASTSPRRRALLALLRLPFGLATPDVDETPLPGEAPTALVRRLARLKAEAIAREQPTAVVLAADTVVALGDEALGKPMDANDAARMLRALRGVPHNVFTGLAVARGAQVWEDVIASQVTMRPYTDADIAAYVASDDPLDKAGAYAIQHPHFAPVARLDGCYANVVGLPLCAVRGLLAQAGVAVPPSLVDGCAPPTVCVVPENIIP